MNRHRSYWPLDDAPVVDGDSAFVGVNARLSPSQLQDGEVSHAVNMRFDSGRAETRAGIRIMTWGSRGIQGGSAAISVPYGAVRRAEAFNDPASGVEWLLVVRGADGDLPLGASYRARPGNTGQVVPAPPGTNFDPCADLIQTYNGMVMLRGANFDPLYLDNLDAGWKLVPAPAPTEVDKEAIPRATQGLYFGNRLFLVDARTDAAHVDSVWVSDLGGASSVIQGRSNFYQSFRINQGSADRLTGIAKFNDTTLIGAKGRSIYAVSNVFGTNDEMAQAARLDQVTDSYGCIARRSFVQVGSDLWFLGHRRGICSIGQTTTNALQGVDVPVSRDIQPIIDRINWEYAAGCVAIAHDNRVFFAVPLDGSVDNNAVLVFSTLTQRWAGYDFSESTNVRDFIKFSYAGGIRVGFLSIDGFICLYEDGDLDHAGDEAGHLTYNAIQSTVRTRGYAGRLPGSKRFRRVTARLRTLHTVATVRAIQDGQAESRLVNTIGLDNTRYRRPYGRAAWDASNVDQDHGEPHREDYAVDMAGPADAGVYVTDNAGDGTMTWGVMQDTEFQNRLRDTGGCLQIEISSTQGRLEVAGVTVDAARGATHDGLID